MPVENAQTIKGLNPLNPGREEPVGDGDDHVRLIKAVLLACLPNIDGAVTLTHAEINALATRATALENNALLRFVLNGIPFVDAGGHILANLGYPRIGSDAANAQWVADLVAEAVAATKASLYPIGTIYEHGYSAANPATYLGFGVWAPYGPGRVVVGAGEGTDSRGYTLGFAPGQEFGEYHHVLTEAEMPPHSHANGSFDRLLKADGAGVATGGAGSGPNITTSQAILSKGSGSAHNNIQPVIGAYRWIRTA